MRPLGGEALRAHTGGTAGHTMGCVSRSRHYTRWKRKKSRGNDTKGVLQSSYEIALANASTDADVEPQTSRLKTKPTAYQRRNSKKQ